MPLAQAMAYGMQPRCVELCVCPDCAGPLGLVEVRASDGDEIMDGALGCAHCSRRYPITRGVPRLMPATGGVSADAQETVDRFGWQWNEFDFLADRYEAQFLGWIAPRTPADFRGRRVFEGGCGKGRHSALMADWGASDVIALDLGSAVDAAFRNTRDRKNVHVVQGDLFHPPVPKASVDVALSVGVVHHTPDPAGCFDGLVELLRPGGLVVVWVYGRENNEWIVRFVNPVREGVTSKLPHRLIYQLAKLPAAMIVGVGRGVYRPIASHGPSWLQKRLFYRPYIEQISSFPFEEVHSIVHDHLTPPIAHYLPRTEVASWVERHGLEAATIGWHNENSWRVSGRKPGAHDGPARAE